MSVRDDNGETKSSEGNNRSCSDPVPDGQMYHRQADRDLFQSF